MIQVKLVITVEVDPKDLVGHPAGVAWEVCDLVDDLFKEGPAEHCMGLISVDPL